MQRRPLHVLGEAVLLGDAAGAHDAGDRRGAGEALLLHQQLQRPVAPAAGRHLVHAGLGTALVQHRPDGEALQQRAPGDVLGQLLDRHAGLDAAHVGLAEDELVEGDVPRYAQGDLGLRLGHGRVSGCSATGRPGASLPASSGPVTKLLIPPLPLGPCAGWERGCEAGMRRRHVRPSVPGSCPRRSPGLPLLADGRGRRADSRPPSMPPMPRARSRDPARSGDRSRRQCNRHAARSERRREQQHTYADDKFDAQLFVDV